MNKTKIEWTDYSWSPVVGCKNGCWYCYAKRMNDRFQWIEKWNEPKFYPERLQEPYKLKKPSKIFVCSIADLFGDWILHEWIIEIVRVAYQNPQHTFQFLTKNPKRYLEFDFPDNCWLGATIESEDFYWRKSWLSKKKLESNNKIFVSIEPILGKFNPMFFVNLDLVIVGAMTGIKAIKPKREWIDSIQHPNIFWKENIKKYL